MEFWRMGTGSKAYIERLGKKYKDVESFTVSTRDKGKRVEMVDDAESKQIIDVFTSSATARQFLVVLEALGFIDLMKNGSYRVLTTDYDHERVTEFIFKPSEDKKIAIYRDSRIICCLSCMHKLNDFPFAGTITLTRSSKEPTEENFAKEASTWEKDTLKSEKKKSDFLRKVENANNFGIKQEKYHWSAAK